MEVLDVADTRVLEEGWTVRRAAQAAGVSDRTTYKWLARFHSEGRSGLADRSSRPLRCPRRIPRALVRRIERLRRRSSFAEIRSPWKKAKAVAMLPATISASVTPGPVTFGASPSQRDGGSGRNRLEAAARIPWHLRKSRI
ncbi:MAG: leucine zipper domain-containing protein [Myxococcota bacterium]